jgi:bifunctional pyridoxal-dependent enzyme with beta-cystathionase and maltose regulon repressor activities
VVVATDERALAALDHFPPEVANRASILGLHADIAEYRDVAWLDATIAAGRGHARINLACQPAVLDEAVDRMAAALG